MNVIEAVRKILTDYEDIGDFANVVHIDFTANNNKDRVGLSPTGDTLVSEDVVGNEVRRHTFMMYACNQAITDFDRLSNSNFLLKLGYYLDGIKNYSFDGGVINSITASNQMLLSTVDGDMNGEVMYQIQITCDYKLIKEE